MMCRSMATLRIWLSIVALSCCGLTVAASEPPTHWFRVANKFQVQPRPVQVVGQAGIYPVAGAVLLDPMPGRTIDSFPVARGATQAAIPAHSIYLHPFVPSPGGAFSVHGLLPTSEPWYKVQFPAMVVNLPHPVPEGNDTMTIHLNAPLNMSTTVMPFTLPIIAMPGGSGTVNSYAAGPTELPLMPVITLTLEFQGRDPVYHYGLLNYALTSESRADHPVPWSWQIGGWWEVEIWDYHKEPDIARLTHHRRFNTVGGALESASEPAVPALGPLAVTSSGSANRPHYRIQFARMEGGGSHTLVFVNNRPQGPPTNTQPFPSVAMIALGQWMKKKGGPDLKVSAPLVDQDQPETWTVAVDGKRQMTLSWCLE